METVNQKKTFNNLIISRLLYLLPILGFAYLLFYGKSSVEMGILILMLFTSLVIFLAGFTYTITKIFVLLLNVTSLLVTGIFYSSWGSIIQFLTLLILLLVLNDIIVDRKVYKNLHLLTFVLLTLFVYTIKIPDNLTHIRLLSGSNINPNMLAMIALAAFGHFKCFIDETNIHKSKRGILTLLFVVVTVYKILQLECRSALIVLLGFVVASMIIRKPLKYKTYKLLSIIIMVGSLLFVLLYMWLYYKVGNIQILGKSLFTGREIIWGSAIDIIKEHFIFGCGNSIRFDTVHDMVTTTSHNTLIGLWKILGIIPTISFVFMLANNPCTKKQYNMLKTPQLFFLCSLVFCFFESFYTDAALFLFYVLFLTIRVERENENDT